MAVSNESIDLIDEIHRMAHNKELDNVDEGVISPMADIMRTLLNARGSTKQLADKYGKSPQDIRNVLNRRPIPVNEKPTPRNTYRWSWFDTIVPNSWKRNTTAE